MGQMIAFLVFAALAVYADYLIFESKENQR